MADSLLTCLECDWTGPAVQCVLVDGVRSCPMCASEVSEEETPLFVELPT